MMSSHVKPLTTTPPIPIDVQIQRSFEIASNLCVRKPQKAFEKFKKTIQLLGTMDDYLAKPHRLVMLAKSRVKMAELSPQDAEFRASVKEQLGSLLSLAIQATEGSPCRQAVVQDLNLILIDYADYLKNMRKA